FGQSSRENIRFLLDSYGDTLPPGAIARLGSVRFRHDATSVGFSPDSMTLVSSGTGIRIWDATTRRIQNQILGGDYIASFAFSPDGQKILLAGRLSLIDIVTLSEFKLQSVRGSFDCVAFSPDGRTVGAAGSDGDLIQIILWDVATGKTIRRMKAHSKE